MISTRVPSVISADGWPLKPLLASMIVSELPVVIVAVGLGGQNSALRADLHVPIAQLAICTSWKNIHLIQLQTKLFESGPLI